MLKLFEKNSIRRLPTGAVVNGAISAKTKGGDPDNQYDGEVQKRIQNGLSAD